MRGRSRTGWAEEIAPWLLCADDLPVAAAPVEPYSDVGRGRCLVLDGVVLSRGRADAVDRGAATARHGQVLVVARDHVRHPVRVVVDAVVVLE